MHGRYSFYYSTLASRSVVFPLSSNSQPPLKIESEGFISMNGVQAGSTVVVGRGLHAEWTAL